MAQARADPFDAPPGLGRLAGEREAGQRRRDHVERIGRVAPERDRVDQRLDHLVELDDRTRPAVRDQQRHRVGVRRPVVDEVDVEPVDLGDELVEAVEAALASAPVVLVGPVRGELADVRERDALRPVVDQFTVGPAGVVQPRAQVVEHRLGNVDRERPDLSLMRPR